jgi:hypothetical protein
MAKTLTRRTLLLAAPLALVLLGGAIFAWGMASSEPDGKSHRSVAMV